MTEEEFRTVFQKYKDAVYQFAWRLTGCSATAEDIAQEVFLVLWRGQTKVDAARGSWRSLLLGVARNLAWKRWRRDRRWASLDDDTVQVVPPAVEIFGVQDAVSRAVQALPPLQREALILATYSELSLQEIAEMTRVEIGTVKARLHRARENLIAGMISEHDRLPRYQKWLRALRAFSRRPGYSSSSAGFPPEPAVPCHVFETGLFAEPSRQHDRVAVLELQD